MPKQAQVPGDDVIGDDGQALAACEVGGVDEGAQFADDLPGPDRVRVGLGGVLQVTQQVSCAELVAEPVEGVGRVGPVRSFMDEPGHFPGSLPEPGVRLLPHRAFPRFMPRARRGLRGVLVAGGADDERLAPHFAIGRPTWLARSRFPHFLEAGDLVELPQWCRVSQSSRPPPAEPCDQFLAGIGRRGGRGVMDDRPLVLPQGDPAESRYQVLLALAVPPGLEAGPRPVSWCSILAL